MYSELKIQYYRTAILQTKRGNGRGVIINAKPILLLALFEHIENGLIVNNKVLFCEELKKCYEKHYSFFESGKNKTPFYKPFFHLQSDGYWHLSWSNEEKRKNPSNRYLRDNVKYASFDNALWDLLQDVEIRRILREVIINYFLPPNNV